MRRVAWVEGIVAAPEEARVSVYDRGFLYGHAVFEVLRTYGGRPFALADHVARLRASSAKVGIDLPWSDAELAAVVHAALAAARDVGDEKGEAYLRFMVTGGDGFGLAEPVLRPRRVILVEPLPPARPLEELALEVLLVHAPRDGDATAARGDAPGTAKVTGYLGTLLALADARREGAGDVLYVDGEGEDASLREGGTSNVFLVLGTKTGQPQLVTPPLAEHILPGITRAHLLALARAAGLAVEERPLRVVDLLTADEVFLSSTVREIVPVVAARGLGAGARRVVGGGGPGPLAEKLLGLLRASAENSP